MPRKRLPSDRLFEDLHAEELDDVEIVSSRYVYGTGSPFGPVRSNSEDIDRTLERPLRRRANG